MRKKRKISDCWRVEGWGAESAGIGFAQVVQAVFGFVDSSTATCDMDVHSVPIQAGALVSLCFASVNQDASVFESPEEIRLDRKPNPHVTFGFGPHLCLGAPHARLVVRTLLKKLCERIKAIEVLKVQKRLEWGMSYERSLAYDRLTVRFSLNS